MRQGSCSAAESSWSSAPTLVVEPNRSIVVVVLVAAPSPSSLTNHGDSGDGNRDRVGSTAGTCQCACASRHAPDGQALPTAAGDWPSDVHVSGFPRTREASGRPDQHRGQPDRTCRDVGRSSRRALVPIPQVSRRGSLRPPRASETRRMNRRAHGLGRGLSCLGLLSTSAYLGWRITTLPSHTPTWLVAARPRRRDRRVPGIHPVDVGPVADEPVDGSGRAVEPSPVDVVVRVDQQPVHHARRHIAGHAVDGRRPTRRRRPRGQTRHRRARRRVRRGVRGARHRRSQRPEDLRRRGVDLALLVAGRRRHPTRRCHQHAVAADRRRPGRRGDRSVVDGRRRFGRARPERSARADVRAPEPQPGARSAGCGDPRRVRVP